MPITTINEAVAGMRPWLPFGKALTGSIGTLVAGRPFSTWAIAGAPGAGAYDTTSAGIVLRAGKRLSSTVTMTIASPAVVTWTNHGLEVNDPIIFTTSGALPTGVTAGTIYYVRNPTASTFEFSATPGGAAVNSSVSQSGTHTCTTNDWPGQIPFDNPASGNTHLARFLAQTTIAGTLILADRLWHNGGFNITLNTSQTVNSVAFPPRDNFGSSNGAGVMLGLEISSNAGAAAPTITVGYTNSAGVPSRTATNYVATANNPTAGSFFPLALQAGDQGVRSVQNLTLSVSWASGTMNLVAYREIARLDLASGHTPAAADILQLGRPQLFNGSVPYLIFIPAATTSTQIQGGLAYTQG